MRTGSVRPDEMTTGAELAAKPFPSGRRGRISGRLTVLPARRGLASSLRLDGAFRPHGPPRERSRPDLPRFPAPDPRQTRGHTRARRRPGTQRRRHRRPVAQEAPRGRSRPGQGAGTGGGSPRVASPRPARAPGGASEPASGVTGAGRRATGRCVGSGSCRGRGRSGAHPVAVRPRLRPGAARVSARRRHRVRGRSLGRRRLVEGPPGARPRHRSRHGALGARARGPRGRAPRRPRGRRRAGVAVHFRRRGSR